jgi:hypothetical protein
MKINCDKNKFFIIILLNRKRIRQNVNNLAFTTSFISTHLNHQCKSQHWHTLQIYHQPLNRFPIALLPSKGSILSTHRFVQKLTPTFIIVPKLQVSDWNHFIIQLTYSNTATNRNTSGVHQNPTTTFYTFLVIINNKTVIQFSSVHTAFLYWPSSTHYQWKHQTSASLWCMPW